jgi:hypothetical protein
VKFIALVVALALAGCASSPDPAPAAPPSLVVAPGQPTPAQAQFYVDCITQAAEARTFDREESVIRFHCQGDVAQRFYEGLGPWSAEVGSQYESDGVAWRFSTPIRENPSFVDFCRSHDEFVPRFDCTVVLNVGEFLAE